MRLIDADLLAKTIEKAQMEGTRVNVLSLIHDAPTIDILVARGKDGIVIPVTMPMGKWITHEEWHPNIRYGCSFCGNLTKERALYCPCCNSRMEAKDETN